MKPIVRLIFYVEIAICFAPITAILFLGVILLPTQLLLMISGQDLLGSAVSVFSTIGGLAGLAALYFVVRKIIQPTAYVPRARVLRLLIVMGVAALVGFFWFIGTTLDRISVAEIVLLVFPLLGTLHILYAGRRQLW